MKILPVFGTRPEAIKLAPVIRSLQAHPAINCRVCVTGQHREMLDQVLQIFNLTPDHDLQLMRQGQSLSDVVAAAFTHLAPIFREEQPDWILVQGDTATVMAAALCAYFHRIQVGHVEAGLRTFDKWQPFPEEINRRIASVVADLHFAPTTTARDNLLREAVNPANVHVTGNTIIDALHQVANMPFDLHNSPFASVDDPSRQSILITVHRRENFGQPVEAICAALRQLVTLHPVNIYYPVHLNPNIHKPVHQLLGNVPHIHLLPPLDYLSLVHLMKRVQLVLTDSGGIQEEAPGLGKPVLVLRDVTERPEAIAAGVSRLVGTHTDTIVAAVTQLLQDPSAYQRMARAHNPYGDGRAAERITRLLLGEPVVELATNPPAPTNETQEPPQ